MRLPGGVCDGATRMTPGHAARRWANMWLYNPVTGEYQFEVCTPPGPYAFPSTGFRNPASAALVFNVPGGECTSSMLLLPARMAEAVAWPRLLEWAGGMASPSGLDGMASPRLDRLVAWPRLWRGWWLGHAGAGVGGLATPPGRLVCEATPSRGWWLGHALLQDWWLGPRPKVEGWWRGHALK